MHSPLPNPFTEDLDAAAKALRDALTDPDPRIRIYAARFITLATTHIQRTNAYLKRCEILNERTRSSVTPHKSPSLSSPPPCPSVNSVVKDSSSPSPEDHLTLPKDSTFREHHVHFLGPKPKTKADYARMATLALNKLHERDAEQSICNEELIVYRAYDNGSFNLATRNHHLKDIRTKHPSRELPPAQGVTLPPDSSLLSSPTPSSPPSTHGSAAMSAPHSPPSPHPGAGEMSRLPSLPSPHPGAGEKSQGSPWRPSDREGASNSPNTLPPNSSATSASGVHPPRQAVNTPKPPRLIHPTPFSPISTMIPARSDRPP